MAAQERRCFLGAGGCGTGACVETPVSGSPLFEHLGGLSINVTPQPPGSTAPVALRVMSSDWGCLDLYIDVDSALVADPVVQLPSEWGTINVPGPEIVPLSTYSVVAECGGFTTAAGSGTTARYGDYNFDGNADFLDIAQSVQSFVDVSVAPLVLMDIAPCTPDGAVDFRDISETVEAFLDMPYPCPPPGLWVLGRIECLTEFYARSPGRPGELCTLAGVEARLDSASTHRRGSLRRGFRVAPRERSQESSAFQRSAHPTLQDSG